jgi:hypothetical protein
VNADGAAAFAEKMRPMMFALMAFFLQCGSAVNQLPRPRARGGMASSGDLRALLDLGGVGSFGIFAVQNRGGVEN